MEPTTNPRVQRTLRRTFYSLSRRYGVQIVLKKVATSDMDYTTGAPTRTYDSKTIRNAVVLPSAQQRDVTFTPAMMQSIRNFAWQGGAGTDKTATTFLIAGRDIRNWGDVDSTQYVEWNSQSIEVEKVTHFDGGVVVTCKSAKGSRP